MFTRHCHVCHVPLEPEDYEGFRVLRCPDWAGHLVDLARYEAIKRLPPPLPMKPMNHPP